MAGSRRTTTRSDVATVASSCSTFGLCDGRASCPLPSGMLAGPDEAVSHIGAVGRTSPVTGEDAVEEEAEEEVVAVEEELAPEVAVTARRRRMSCSKGNCRKGFASAA